MKKNLIFLLAAAFVCASCAKTPSTEINKEAKMYFDSWMSIYHPDLKPVGHGIYILKDTRGTGETIGSVEDYPYLRIDFIACDLHGNIADYSEERVARQLGEYDESSTYVPEIFLRGEGNMNIGLVDALDGMAVGGVREVIIPGWLNSTEVYDTEEEYLAKVSGTPGRYTLKFREQIKDIVAWEVDSLNAYAARHFSLTPADTLKYGMYYVRTGKPASEEAFKSDTTIKINYIGRLLNGKVFDTTIQDTAKLYGIYSDSKTYGSTSVTIAENYSEITLGSSTTIDGFAYMISKMHPGESGIGMFYSGLGYSTSGSGSSIPPYSPLRFDIFVDAPE